MEEENLQGKHFSITDQKGVNTVIYQINKTKKEYLNKYPKYTLERLNSTEEIVGDLNRKTFFVDEPRKQGNQLVILSFGKENVIVNSGLLIGNEVRDKDGIAALMLLAEAATYYKEKGLTLWDNMLKMYETYGYYKENQVSIVLEGADGAEKIKQMMEKVRNNPPKQIGEYKVVKFRDYLNGTIKEMETGESYKKDLPKSNVLYFELENDFWCCMRPSGTEPKIKFYMGVRGSSLEDANRLVESLTEGMKELMN